MSFRKDNDAYEAWLATQCDVVKKDIAYKHQPDEEERLHLPARDLFPLGQDRSRRLCPDLMDAPQVLGVGDLHLENFGTWRDADGRLVWGVNDFDEAAVMPYPLDLVRLAASIRLAPKLDVSNPAAAEALLRGLPRRPRPAAAGAAVRRRDLAAPLRRTRRRQAGEILEGSRRAIRKPSRRRRLPRALIASLPKDVESVRFCSRVGGRRQSRTAALCRGRLLARRPCAARSQGAGAVGLDLGPTDLDKSRASHFLDMANGRYRAPDPFLDVHSKFIFRRLAADSRKIELGADAGAKLKAELVPGDGI